MGNLIWNEITRTDLTEVKKKLRQKNKEIVKGSRQLKKKKAGNYNRPVHEPRFLPKDGHLVCIFPIREGRCKDEFKLFVPKEWRDKYKFKSFVVPVPPNVKGHKIKEVRILPRVKGTYFEIEFVYEVQEEQSNVDNKKVLAIDTGVNNFATCLDTSGRSFILDGRSMKSINRLYNKKRSHYYTILSKQGHKTSKRLQLLGYRNNRRLGEYLNQYHLAQDGTRSRTLASAITWQVKQ